MSKQYATRFCFDYLLISPRRKRKKIEESILLSNAIKKPCIQRHF